jgi:hypothetical protein
MPGSIHESLLPDLRATRIEGAIRRGEMIEAIRLQREATDSSLAGAKDAVDAMAAELLGSQPEQRVPRAHRAGCLSAAGAVSVACRTLPFWICR